MSSILKLLPLALVLILVSPESAGICKWIDSDGIIHYAENCPEEYQPTEVEITPPPTPAQVEAAEQRVEQTKSRTSTRKLQKEQQKEQQALQNNVQDEMTDSKVKACAEARWNLSILGKQLPVYYDEENKLHYNRSLHDSWYQGQRRYLEDHQRQQEIEHLTQVEGQNCTASEDDIRERIRLYMNNDHLEACMSLRNKLKNMQAASTGIPSDEMRDLEELINTRCQ